MTVYEYIIGGILILFSLIIIAVVLLQEGRQANIGAISGGSDSFMDKGMAKTRDMMLSKWTKIIAVVFFVLVFVGMLVTRFLGTAALSEDNAGDSNGTTTTTVAEASTTTAAQ